MPNHLFETALRRQDLESSLNLCASFIHPMDMEGVTKDNDDFLIPDDLPLGSVSEYHEMECAVARILADRLHKKHGDGVFAVESHRDDKHRGSRIRVTIFALKP